MCLKQCYRYYRRVDPCWTVHRAAQHTDHTIHRTLSTRRNWFVHERRNSPALNILIDEIIGPAGFILCEIEDPLSSSCLNASVLITDWTLVFPAHASESRYVTRAQMIVLFRLQRIASLILKQVGVYRDQGVHLPPSSPKRL